MTSRWIMITALGTTVALGACEKRKAPAVETPPEPTSAESAPAPAEPPPAPELEARPAEGAAPEAPSGASDPVRAGASKALVDAGTAILDDGMPDRRDRTSRNGKPSKGDGPSAGGTDRKQGRCGGIAGLRCKGGERCRYARSQFAPPYPDAMGACVAATYCDAPADCEGLMHVMVVGEWACARSRCAWKAEGGSAPQ